MKTPASLSEDGMQRCNGLLSWRQASTYLETINQRYRSLAQRSWQPRRYQPTAASFGVEDLWADDDLRVELLAKVHSGCREQINAVLGAGAVCSVHHSWIRRQYAPANRPPGCAPHSWHQDGALEFDFLAQSAGPYRADSLLNMVTCWISLTPCGAHEPGLELVTQRQIELLPPSELSAALIRERVADENIWRPVMDAGDALLFRGDMLHRTHVASHMKRDRTSIELRFFPKGEIPGRLRTGRFVGWQ